MILFDDATNKQIQSADPKSSTWVSANAGSGKTRVLTDRVIRLLLHGVNPQHILCLTYTKAAASEMQNRLFERLGSWAMLETGALIKELERLGEADASNEKSIRNARVLFARALEAPGGLKIQTIHSFCSSVLRRFPLEAGISPQFKEMDDRTSKLLRSDVLDEMAGGDQQHIVDEVVRFFTGAEFDRFVAEISNNKSKFDRATNQSDIWEYFEIGADVDAGSILNGVFLGSEKPLLTDLVSKLVDGTVTDQKAGKIIADVDFDRLGLSELEKLEGVFLTKSGANPFTAKLGRFPTKGTRTALGGAITQIENLMMRVESARAKRIALLAAQKTLALHNFAHSFLTIFRKRKQQRGWLDFDDLIILTGQLLQNQAVSQWVLFRLDGGLEHILVDEAQDTSPSQWRVIESLTQDFFTGLGTAHERQRTVFVVGDKKQSIYSFQGADPDEFQDMRSRYAKKLEGIGESLQSVELRHSFRSSQPILSLVDTVFNKLGLPGFDNGVDHLAFHSDLPGRVDLWNVVEKPEQPEQTDWFDPVDKPSPNHESVVLSENIAAHIKTMCDDGIMIPDGFDEGGAIAYRAVNEGDFLILVQGRSLLFHEIIRACKNAGLQIGGADRLKIGGELAVKDLVSLLSFLATPEDDLALAEALKSPLFNWSEQDLFTLAHHRPVGQFLWAALRNNTEHAKTLSVLNSLRSDADFLRPYELLERILTRFSGRKKLLSRLGQEADDGIDALLDQAIAYENIDVPSLTGFLTWLQSDDVEIKRQFDYNSKQIRVMTVHGAKGLESPIVILPDTMKKRSVLRDDIITTEDDFVLWKTAKANSPDVSILAEEGVKRKQEEEKLRLLYVAMTRAEKWLIMCGAGDPGSGNDSWYSIINSAMELSNPTKIKDGLRIQSENWLDKTAKIFAEKSSDLPTTPDWLGRKIAAPKPKKITLSPSELGGEKSLAGEQNENCDVLAHGTAVHLLLEMLPDTPRPEWENVSKNLLSDLNPTDQTIAYLEALDVLKAPNLNHLFARPALVEVPISATLPEIKNYRIHGTIDRLIIDADRVLAIDFKTNAIVPSVPEETPGSILRQLGAYAAALMQIYPDKTIETAVLWTKTQNLMVVDQKIVAAALRHSALP